MRSVAGPLEPTSGLQGANRLGAHTRGGLRITENQPHWLRDARCARWLRS